VAKDTTIHHATDSGGVKDSRLYAFQIRIETGASIGSNTLITGGLKDGDRIVVDGVQTLHDGSPITTANRQGPAAGGRSGR
jgi:membrane fusion protein, multidrug efflux system